ncbi:GGDEF domain-containing protein [Pseudomonas cichorii]|uniref:diguanylate cyclase n=1 Tax=Pseudomonas cichorii TaxID=36746 RepID=A0ABQ1DJ41_PSECI|nr:GGDEF domain-containing protein [Pseudomonas cichorii]AHF68916.1 GGDEF domain-containing protein [Pseudomonas cichorii JBC1]QVE15904.1 GGDEF domain-containing protein [Pseudomonas cichorii]GFM91023.1 GGDEF domain-containing protein [Pseudomonas cichorii]SDN26035.1 diguanylate cyclase (GGDEF) domain-containing protein [Pseudomonas cichorii]
MSSPTGPKTIDFDTARLQRLDSRTRPAAPLPPADLPTLIQQLSQQLQSSLEAEKILGMFFRGIQRLMPLSALIYEHSRSDLSLQLGESAEHRAHYTLRHMNECLGNLEFQRDTAFSEQELGELESLIICLLYPMKNALLYRIAMQSALRDPLTNTGNRIAMDQNLMLEIEVSHRQKQPLSVLMLDIDYFKNVNDNFGHKTGDEVLRTIAHTLKTQLRSVDRMFRYGGEEFVVVLANTDRECAAMIGERLRQAVLELKFHESNTVLNTTISLGCSTLLPAESADSLLRRADKALYVAKREGRNRLNMAG